MAVLTALRGVFQWASVRWIFSHQLCGQMVWGINNIISGGNFCFGDNTFNHTFIKGVALNKTRNVPSYIQ